MPFRMSKVESLIRADGNGYGPGGSNRVCAAHVEREEEVYVQALILEPAVERLDEGVLHGPPRPDEDEWTPY